MAISNQIEPEYKLSAVKEYLGGNGSLNKIAEKYKNEPKKCEKDQKNLVFATLISTPGPVALIISMTGGAGVAQMADLIRRSCEFLTIFSAWMVYKITTQDCSKNDISKTRLEAFVRYFTGLYLLQYGLYGGKRLVQGQG